MKINLIRILFTEMKFKSSDLPKLRGYFANKYSEYAEFHNHLPGGKFSYKFPHIQYRNIGNHPALIGLHNGIEILKKVFFELDEMIINNHKYKINEKEIMLNEHLFGVSEKFINYKFLSPWMALNEDNYKKYNKMNKFEQQLFLKKILKGNLMTLSKGFEYTIPNLNDIKVEGYFKSMRINFKNQKMLCFTGAFTTNFYIPDYLGLGKQSARGFGVVQSDEIKRR